MKDKVLYDYIPLLIEMSKINEIRDVIPKFVRNHNFDITHAMQCCINQIKLEQKKLQKTK